MRQGILTAITCMRSGTAMIFLCAGMASAQSTLPPVPVPAANPITESKRVLGKILFWDEQLSSDNTVACGTCHMPDAGGAELAPANSPGPDLIFNTPDDVLGSRGVIASSALDAYTRSLPFNFNAQVTTRSANPAINAMFSPSLFWDGRALSQFTDPETNQVLIPAGGALESQAVGPIVSSVEMAHANRNWGQVTAKLQTAGPLALATALPPDVDAAIQSFPSYPALFEAAFGTNQITAARIAFAIATYERTLVSDQAPWDRFMQGVPNAMTPGQVQGWNNFQASECDICHAPPLFTDNTFRNIGVRPNNQDIGREAVTNNPADRGKFKVPSLRNLATRRNFMHTGQFNNLQAQVFPFYAGPGAPGNPNRDPILPSPIPPQQANAVADFILNGLRDPRVATRQFPFDRPTLHAQVAPSNPLLGAGVAGTGGLTPRMIAVCPPNVGNSGFKIGLDQSQPGAQAFVAISSQPPVAGVISAANLSGPFTVAGTVAGQGFATFQWPIPADPDLDGDIVFMQWRIADPAAAGGVALSPVVQLLIFGGELIVPPDCSGDANGDRSIDAADLSVLLSQFGQSISAGTDADLNGDGIVDSADLSVILSRFGSSC